MRLGWDTNTGSANEGYLEVYANGLWGNVCLSTSIGIGQVVCRQLGYATGRPMYSGELDDTLVSTARFSWIDRIHCEGEEASIDRCAIGTWRMQDCEELPVSIHCCKIADIDN